MKPIVFTIGVYGFKESAFFERLSGAGVQVFCDLRARRGVRGAQYAFANSQRLQARLAELGMRYVHVKALAPPREVRETQYLADAATGVGKRTRTALSSKFIDAYESTCLSNFDARAFIELADGGATAIALFCVERDARACHRSLVAARLNEQLGLRVEHLVP